MYDIITGSGIVLASALILMIICSWIFARLWCRPIRKISGEKPDDRGMPFESVRFTSKGLFLNGWLIHGNGSTPGPAIILPHGWSGNAADVLPLARVLYDAGYTTLLYNSRGHGDSPGDGPITILKIAEDIISAVDYLETRTDIVPDKIGIVGHSIGASAAIVAAAFDSRLKTIVSSAAFADPRQLTRETMRKMHVPRGPMFYLVAYFIERWLGRSMDGIAPKNLIKKVRADLLLVHGDADKFISPRNLDILFAQADKTKTHWRLIKGAGHASIIKYLAYENNLLVRFLNERLRGEINGAKILG